MSDKTIDILMFGMNRTGKSSILASMMGSFKEVARDTNFNLTATDTTSQIVDSKLIKLRNVFDEYWGMDSFTIDESPSAGFDEYMFTVTYKNKLKEQKLADLRFHDYAGEFLLANEKKSELEGKEFENAKASLTEKIRKASIIMVAVDTVHLMEEGGKFSSVYHKPKILKNMIGTSGFIDDANNDPKMVLFVPLKCEKYYYENRMEEVTQKVEKEFGELIDYLTKDNLKNRITIAVTPILTMGAIAFDHFGRDENGKVIRQKIQGQPNNLRPQSVYYKFVGKKKFSPRYCEQPVLYALSFVVNSAKKAQETNKLKKGSNLIRNTILIAMFSYVFAAIYLVVWLLMRSKEFNKDYDSISDNLKKTGDGYEILQNPLDL